MLRKRLVGVITVKNGWAVQSIGYQRYLPLGKPEILAENLDRWGADEIILQCIDRSTGQLGPDIKLLERVARQGLGTPLIYAGGIRNAIDGKALVQSGADRLCVDALLHDDLDAVHELSVILGAQALIGALPLSLDQGRLLWLDYRQRASHAIDEAVIQLLRDDVLSEAVIIDWQNDGRNGQFNHELLRLFPLTGQRLIAFGGMGGVQTIRDALKLPAVAAIAVGNRLNYCEHAVQALRQQVGDADLRVIC